MKQISVDELNLIMKYLGARPYAEVFHIIAMLSKLPEIESKNGGQKNTKQ